MSEPEPLYPVQSALSNETMWVSREDYDLIQAFNKGKTT